jgi:hypothetical protein
MFTCLMHQTPRDVTDAIINVHRTGEGQRQTIMAVANTVFGDGSPERAFIRDLKLCTDQLTGRRNALLHSIIYIPKALVTPQVVASGTTKPSRATDLDLLKELDECLTEAKRLSEAVETFVMAMDVTGMRSTDLTPPRLKDGWSNPLTRTDSPPSPGTSR